MEFYRWNGLNGQTHIALDIDGPVCGSNSLVSEAKERLKLNHNSLISSMDYPQPQLEIHQIISCKKCLKWYIKSRFSGKYLDHKL